MNEQRQKKKPPRWCAGEYTSGIILRFFLLIMLWIFYALIPHKYPLGLLHAFSIALICYDIYLFWQKRYLMAWLILLAIGLNELLVLYINPGFNLIVTIIIAAILLFDIVNAP